MKTFRSYSLSAIAVLAGAGAILPGNATPEAEVAVFKSNALGLGVLQRMINQNVSPNGNIVISPAGLGSTLSILQPGAKGETKSILDQFLTPSDNTLQSAHEWRNMRQQNRIVLNFAERVFLSDRFVVDDFYPAQSMVTRLDFAQNPVESVSKINKWVAQNTDQIFQMTLPDGAIGENTSMVAIGSYAFAGVWQYPFPASSVAKGNFRADMRNVEATMMSRTLTVPHTTTPNYTMLALPYSVLSTTESKTPPAPLYMVMLMPPESSNLRDFVKGLTPDSLQKMLPATSSPEVGEILATVPAFKTVTAYSPSLKPFLEFAGLGNLFDPAQADFSGLVATPTSHPLFLSDFYQQCLVTVAPEASKTNSETSTEANAAPAATEQVPQIVINRPFFWCVYDPNSGAILFMGTEFDPSQFVPNPYDSVEYEHDLSVPNPLSPLNQLHREQRDKALEQIPVE